MLRRLDTIETFVSDETEFETDTIRENQTTDRNEMQRETQRTINEAMGFNTDVSVSYDGPMVDVNANAGFCMTVAQKIARNATNFAKEVVNKSVERISSGFVPCAPPDVPAKQKKQIHTELIM
ncbi:MAG: hypothetical protein IPH04_18860 [Saprospirales bacterium]|nr:hypothetical protein [Saprospirales bacterium]